MKNNNYSGLPDNSDSLIEKADIFFQPNYDLSILPMTKDGAFKIRLWDVGLRIGLAYKI